MKASAMQRLALLAAAMPLLVLYGWVGWQALHPRVSDEYRLTYIEGALQHWPGPDGLAYRVGERLPLSGQPLHLGEAWGGPKRIGWWHIRKPAKVYVKLRETVSGKVTFEAEVPAAEVPVDDVAAPVRVRLFVNSRLADSVAYAPAAHDRALTWHYDGALLRVGLNIFTLDLPKTEPRTVLCVRSLVPARSVADRPSHAEPVG